jgi:hypothetical protein
MNASHTCLIDFGQRCPLGRPLVWSTNPRTTWSSPMRATPVARIDLLLFLLPFLWEGPLTIPRRLLSDLVRQAGQILMGPRDGLFRDRFGAETGAEPTGVAPCSCPVPLSTDSHPSPTPLSLLVRKEDSLGAVR